MSGGENYEEDHCNHCNTDAGCRMYVHPRRQGCRRYGYDGCVTSLQHQQQKHRCIVVYPERFGLYD